MLFAMSISRNTAIVNTIRPEDQYRRFNCFFARYFLTMKNVKPALKINITIVENVTKAVETTENIIYNCNLEYKYSFFIKVSRHSDFMEK